MKTMKNNPVTRRLVLVLLLLLTADVMQAQTQNVLRRWVNEQELTPEEKNYFDASPVQKNASAWKIAELDFDVNSEVFLLSLPDGSGIELISQRVKHYHGDAATWRGQSADGKSSGTITVHRGQLTARISPDPKTVWMILPVSQQRHIIYRVDASKAQKEESPQQYARMLDGPAAGSERVRKEEPGEVLGDGLLGDDCYVRILVGFESGINLADPVGFAIECIELSNTIYANSQINFEAELAVARVYPQNASSDIDEALFQWQVDEPFDNSFNEVFSDREQYDADFCILVVNDFTGDYVGLAATILASYSSAFCVVESGAALDNLSFTHEIGHLMGARHDEYVDDSGDYNHGYIIHSEEVRTVMAYNDECEDNGYDCDRVEYFSTPDVTYLGTGKVLGTAETEHNERALDENESEFADFEPVVSDKLFSFPEFVDEEMFASVTALSSIDHLAQYEVTGGATVVWSAGSDLYLEPGFFVAQGSTFEGKIAGCNASRMGEESGTEAAEAVGVEGISAEIFPNPAAGETKLSLELSRDTEVTINWRDMAGRLLLELAQAEYRPAGLHEFHLHLEDITPGVYFFEIRVTGGQLVKKLVVQQ
jgi:hypothetical protein